MIDDLRNRFPEFLPWAYSNGWPMESLKYHSGLPYLIILRPAAFIHPFTHPTPYAYYFFHNHSSMHLCSFYGRHLDASRRTVPKCRPVQSEVSKGVGDGCKPLALRAGHPRNGHKAVSGVAHPQGIEGSGIAGPGATLGSP
jgi:hypothetical protein